jgi:hypothetical protein
VLARHVRNRRLYDAVDQWAFCALSTSTTKLYAPWATGSSASCTVVYATTPATTNTPPGPTAYQRRLDDLPPWDV